MKINSIEALKVMLEETIKDSKQVFILPHDGPDFDAIGGALGLNKIVKKLKKNSYIIINDEEEVLEPGVFQVIKDVKNDYSIINKKDYERIRTDNDLLITVDVNKKNLISLNDSLHDFKRVAIIDHHKETEDTIKTPFKYVDTNASSTCEIIFELLKTFNIRIGQKESNYLYAGIFLDTAKFTKNISSKTLEIASYLLKSGVDINYVNKLFEEDFEKYRKVQKLVDSAKFMKYTVAVASYERMLFEKEELAKAADSLLNFGADATFVLGYLNHELLGMSARSNGNIDVGNIMHYFGGGGNTHSAAAQIANGKIKTIKNLLVKIFEPGYNLEEVSKKKILKKK